jgi:hypothetical protein
MNGADTFTTTVEGTSDTCDYRPAAMLIPMGAAETGIFHAHAPSPGAERLSGQPGDPKPGDIGESQRASDPISLGTPGGRIIISYPMLQCQLFIQGVVVQFFRMRKGRLRICWIASSKIRPVLILFISETLRKDGDVNDPYLIFQSMMDAGVFDSVLHDFGVRMARFRHAEGYAGKPH